jgi:beta-lactamase class A
MPNHHFTYRRPPSVSPPVYKANSQKRLKKGFVAILIILSLTTVYYFNQPFGSPSKSNQQKVAAAAKPSLSATQQAEMSKEVNNIISNYPSLETGVAVTDLNSNKSYQYGVNQPYIAASISKLITACLFLHEVEAGKYSLSDAVGDASAKYQLRQLIEQSDNDAWLAFNDLLTHDSLKDYANSIGINNYDPDENTLSVSDVALLLSKLYKNQLLSPANTKLLLSFMQNANEDDFIVASVPDGAKVYHKAGWLDDRVHDAAIIDDGKHPYVLVIFTKDDSGQYDSQLGHQIFDELTRATTKQFI